MVSNQTIEEFKIWCDMKGIKSFLIYNADNSQTKNQIRGFSKRVSDTYMITLDRLIAYYQLYYCRIKFESSTERYWPDTVEHIQVIMEDENSMNYEQLVLRDLRLTVRRKQAELDELRKYV